MTDAFYLAAVPDSWEILGVKLLAFSLGHVILLHRIKSPFIDGSTAPTFDDLALAILICSETYSNGLRIIEDPALPKTLRRWADKLTGMDQWLVRHYWKRGKILDFLQPAIDFADYIREHSKIPNYDFNPGDFRELHCPEAQVVKVTLMREMGFTEAELLDRGWGLCLWDYVTLRALDGKVKMISEEVKSDALNVANELLAKIKSGEIQIPGNH